jgi:hypothetical protein
MQRVLPSVGNRQRYYRCAPRRLSITQQRKGWHLNLPIQRDLTLFLSSTACHQNEYLNPSWIKRRVCIAPGQDDCVLRTGVGKAHCHNLVLAACCFPSAEAVSAMAFEVLHQLTCPIAEPPSEQRWSVRAQTTIKIESLPACIQKSLYGGVDLLEK